MARMFTCSTYKFCGLNFILISPPFEVGFVKIIKLVSDELKSQSDGLRFISLPLFYPEDMMAGSCVGSKDKTGLVHRESLVIIASNLLC